MNTLESLTQSFVSTFGQSDNIDLKRAKLAYAACSSESDGGLGISTRDFADAIALSAGRGFKQSSVARYVAAYRLAFQAGTTPNAAIVGAALSLLNNGRKVGETFASIALAVLDVNADLRQGALVTALAVALDDMRVNALAARTARNDSHADKIAAMLAPSPVGDDREASDRGIAPVPPSLDDLLASIEALTVRFASLSTDEKARVFDAAVALGEAIDADLATVA